MAEVFNLAFLSYFKVLIVAILIYAIIYAVLIKLEIFGKKEVNSLIALMAAIIVSFSGVVTYSVSYAINWFVIVIFIIFLLMVILMFLGVKSGDIAGAAQKNSKTIMIIFFVIFSVIIIKSFFALNNAFDTSNPPEDQYEIDTSFNTGVDDMASDDENVFTWISDMFGGIDDDVISSFLFLAAVGIFVFFLGR